MKRLQKLLILIPLLVAGATISARAKSPAFKARRAHVLHYKLKADATQAQRDAFNAVLQRHHFRSEKHFRSRVQEIIAPTATATEEELANQLKATGAVIYAEPDYLVPPALVPNDPQYANQWWPNAIHLPTTWDQTTGSPSVTIAVCDSGIDAAHPDLAPNLSLPGYNSVHNNSDTSAGAPHGTAVAGCAGAVGNNGIGIAGVDWSSKILPIKITDANDSFAFCSDIVTGIEWAADHGARVINLSYQVVSGAGGCPDTVNDAGHYAWDKGALLFVSAGNYSTDITPYCPTGPKYFALVGATDISNRRALFPDPTETGSNYGACIDFVAPGSMILTTDVGGGYSNWWGTSFASPISAGVAGLIFSISPFFTPSDVLNLMTSTAQDIGAPGKDNFYGNGLVDANAAITAARAALPTLVPIINSAATAALTIGTPLDYQITALRAPVSYSATGLPPSGSLSLNTATGLMSGTPGVADLGTYSVTLQATNTNGASAPFTLTLSITAPAPVAPNVNLVAPFNTTLPITFNGSDPNNLPLTYTIAANPLHGKIGVVTGNQTTYTPTPGYSGADRFYYQVSNGFSSSVGTIQITVASPQYTLALDRTNYVVGEIPVYSIQGAAPSAPILWSSWLNGVPTGENNTGYGQTTDASGNWSSPASTGWTAAHVGFWTKQASINGTIATINFYVSPSLASLTPGPATPAGQMLGIDDWNGNYPAFHLSSDPLPVEDAKIIQNLNSKVILLPMGPQIAADFPGTNFGAPINTLTDLAKSPPFQQIFTMSFSTYVLTAYAFTDPGALSTPNLTAEQKEISDLVVYLLQTYKGTGKTFIIKNWEGEWAMTEEANGGNNVRPYVFSSTLLQNMTNWLNSRHTGLLNGRAAAGSVTGVAVHDAVEFVWLPEGLQNRTGMLTNVIPNVQSEYVSYSSYDTINKYANVPSLRRGILDDLTYLRHYPGLNGRPLFIGEFGFSLTNSPTDADQRATIAAQAFMDLSMPLALYWVAADNLNGFGLATPSNTRTAVWTALRTLLGAQNNAVASITAPAQMVAGATYKINVQMQNTGNVPWDSVNTYHLALQNPADSTLWGISRADLAAADSIAPGATKTFQFNVTAPTTPGPYALRWQMTQDVVGLFGSATNASVTVATNQPPVVSAGSHQTLVLPAFAALAGSATDDGLPYGVLSTTWSVVSGPGSVIFSSTYTAVSNAVFSKAGVYVLQLIADDGQLTTAKQVTITVQGTGVLVLTKSANVTTAKADDVITYMIQYQNTGNGDALNAAIDDPLPAGATLIPSSISPGGTLIGPTVHWALGTVSAGASGTVQFQMKAN